MPTQVLIIETHGAFYAAELRKRFTGVTVTAVASASELPEDLDHFDVLIAFGIGINDAILKRMTGLKWIQSLATGVDHFLRCQSLRREVLLTSSRGIHAAPMRESALFMMLAVNRNAGRLARNQRDHHWQRHPWPLLDGKTAVIAGTGVSGSAVASALKALGMHTIGITRTPRAVDGFDELATFDQLPQCVARADYVINILPGSEDNAQVFDATVFSRMKPSAYFINIGRGETVDERALIAALGADGIAGAALDVFAGGALAADSPFWDMPNVFVTPHIAGFCNEYEELALPVIERNMTCFLEGRPDAMHNLIAR
ncbi:D-2-hydroxyacid dehydrogenase [Breoghania sp. L-A4]|uniref:D-2-hydroxyacid dehydrogenase n=1 Tax=Breoghania sp. L-A4 TaxID=2304600 RepID=UPI000E35C467|nr:D-2-hydroxyacid dehydrogenase [Breoghania sp. L-A4]AXS42169.1 D-2-hydroxyacid dehydrogenase [Breoghania sp. L-A4]